MDYMQAMIGQLGIPSWMFPLVVIILIWSAIWKGLALWKSARNNSPIWFVVLFLVNTVGILEILYIFVFSKYSKKKVSRQRTKRRR
jgi:Family of unknown function (DUF5652)